MFDVIGQGGKLGQCFTPDTVADVLAAAIPESELLRDDFVCSDPCCGSGSLIGAVVRRRLALGVDPAVIARGIHAFDKDPEQVEGCKARLRQLLGDYDFNVQHQSW